MTALGLFGLWLGYTAGAVVALLWAANQDVQADPPDAHDAATCGACAVADDPVLVRFDLSLWAMEQEEGAS